MFGFLASLASKVIPAITGLFSRAAPVVAKAVAVGKNIIPKVANAVGKAQTIFSTGQAVGKAVKGALDKTAPSLAQKVEEEYNKKRVKGMSISDIVEKGNKGLAKASGMANDAKAVFANIPPAPPQFVEKTASGYGF